MKNVNLPAAKRALLCAIFLAATRVLWAQPTSASADSDAMLAMLQTMLEKDPSRSDTWRLIGRLHHQQGRTDEAIRDFRQAIQLQPDNAAAHHDLGKLLANQGNAEAANYHFDQVMALAPQSSYANRLVAAGVRTPPSPAIPDNAADSNVLPAAYEIQTFDGADDLERRLNQLESEAIDPFDRLTAFIEFGALYNTNVSLTPVSRELTGSGGASFQGFFTPNLEYDLSTSEGWKAGPLARGYFTANESEFRSLDLASFQPGAFFETDLTWGDQPVIGRAEYVYSLDLLDGSEFGERHAVTGSLTTILPDADVIYRYLTVSQSNFADDGANPAVDSLDGLTLTAGVSRFYQTGWESMPTWSLGGDLEWADTTGADYRYYAINLHSDATFQICENVTFVPRLGVGYRPYYDFTGAVSRDELTYRIGGKIRWQLTESLAVSAVAGHDRFASENEDFDAERTEGGIVFTIVR